MSTKKKKIPKENNDEYYSVHQTFKSLYKCSSVSLRKELETRYPETWGSTGNQLHSDERRIKRILDKLVKFGLAKRDKIGKEQVYTYIHDGVLGKVHKIANAMNVDFDGIDTYYKRRSSIVSLLNDISDVYYIQTQEEDISQKENIIKDLEAAIENNQNIKIVFNGEFYTISPLKIVQFDGFWYLVAYNTKYFKYRIKNISSVEITNDTYDNELQDRLKLDKWHNIWHTPETPETKIKIHIDNTVFHYFKEKNILGVDTYKSRLTPCHDGMEYELNISHAWELLPTLMQWQKHVTIIDQNGDIDLVGIYQKILGETQKRLVI